MQRMTGIPVFMALLVALSGCKGARGPEVVTIQPAQYDQAFSTVVELVRDRGWEPEFMDRRSGLIETGPVQSGSLLEPWYLNTGSAASIVENTVNNTRTRVRVEFSPAGSRPLAESSPESIDRPDYLGITDTPDLTRADTPLDIRAWVYLEHGHAPYLMRSTWSLSLRSQARPVPADRTWSSAPARKMWVPTSRDRNAERALLAALEATLTPGEPVQADPSTPVPGGGS